MPQKNVIKNYQNNSVYHVFNRGYQKFTIFPQKSDYWRFRRILREKLILMSNQIALKPFCLMPNHFHWKLYQKDARAIEVFMRSTMTQYGLYYSRKYKSSGHLFESSYKAVRIITPDQERRIDEYILSNADVAGFSGWKHVGWTV